MTPSPLAAIDRLLQALNAHDVEAVVSCFAEDYTLTAPAHPQRSFRGPKQVQDNWTQIFAAVPDIAVRVVRSAVNGDSVWTEWEMSGQRRDGRPHLTRGVFIFGVGGEKVLWGRMFLEPVDEAGADMAGAVRAQLGATR